MNSEDFELIDDLMMVLMQSRLWYRISTQDPGLAAAQAELDALLDRLSPDLREELDDAISQNLARVSDAAVLYDLYVAQLAPSLLRHWADFCAYRFTPTQKV